MPPSERKTVLGWMRRNLFSDLFNSVLTVAAAALIFVLARLLLRWAFTTAEWGVIPANFNLIMRGQYPAEEAWRLWLVLYLLGGVVGLMWQLITGRFSFAALVLFVIPLALREVPFFSWTTRFHLLVVAGAGAGGFHLGRFLPIQRGVRAAVYILLAYLVVMLVILRGYSGDAEPMPTVTTILWGGLLLSLFLAFFGIALSFPARRRPRPRPSVQTAGHPRDERALYRIYSRRPTYQPALHGPGHAAALSARRLPARRPRAARPRCNHSLFRCLHRRKRARRPAINLPAVSMRPPRPWD